MTRLLFASVAWDLATPPGTHGVTVIGRGAYREVAGVAQSTTEPIDDLDRLLQTGWRHVSVTVVEARE